MRIEPERMLTNLAADLADVGRRVTTLENQDLTGKLAGMQATLAEVIEALAALQAAPEEESADGPDPMVAPNWAGLDQEQAADAWEVLVTWCREVYRPMYAPALWRPCWYRHPLLRVQLSWLCANWHWSYAPNCPPTRPAEWHTRWWPAVNTFMAEELSRCGPRSDQLLEPVHSPPEGIEADGFEDGRMSVYIEKDIARRPEPERDDD